MRFKTGDLVFAKVRGYPAWPAKVTCGDVPGGGERYSVVFYGTDEFANLSAKNLWIYNNVFKNKFATKIYLYISHIVCQDGNVYFFQQIYVLLVFLET